MAKMEYPEEFEQLWQIYPKRAGGNPKRKAYIAFNARLKQGYEYSDIKAGLLRYIEYCKGTAVIGSPYVQQAATFFGLNEAWEEDWDLPEPEIKETIEQKGARLGIQARPGESMESYTRRIQQAR